MTDRADKKFATLRAELWVRGYVLMRLTDDDEGPVYLLSRGLLARKLRDLGRLEKIVGLAAPKATP